MNRFIWLFLIIVPVGLCAANSNVHVAMYGRIEHLIADDFDNQVSKDMFIIFDEQQNKYIELKVPDHLQKTAKNSEQVEIEGYQDGRFIEVQDMFSLEPKVIEDAPMVGERRVLVIMIDLQDASASQPLNLAQIGRDTFTSSLSVNSLYKDASLNQLYLNGDSNQDGRLDLFGPYLVNSSSTTCDYSNWALAAEQAAVAEGVDLSLYQHRMFIVPPGISCGWAGIAYLGCGTFCRMWTAEAQSPMVTAHELGHNLGMHHAGDINRSDVGGEYGDLSDTMGFSRSYHVFNMPHVHQMGWYPSSSIIDISGPGSYEIAAVGIDPDQNNHHALRVAADGLYYYLSYRQPFGFDTSLNAIYTSGVNVHTYAGSGSNRTKYVKTLADGEVYTIGDVTIRQVSHNTNGVFVEVDQAGTCTSNNPKLSLDNTLVYHPAAISLSLLNNDSQCTSTTFSLSAGKAGLFVPQNLSLSPQQNGVSSFMLDTSGLMEGIYPINITATDTDGQDPAHPDQSIVGSYIYDVSPPSVPNGLRYSLSRNRQSLTLQWNRSADNVAGLVFYSVYRDGVYLGSAAGEIFIDQGVRKRRNYTYQVVALDKANNASALSEPLRAIVNRID